MKVNKLQMFHNLRNSHVEILCASMEAGVKDASRMQVVYREKIPSGLLNSRGMFIFAVRFVNEKCIQSHVNVVILRRMFTVFCCCFYA